MEDVVILSAVRTPIGLVKGSLSALKSHQLGAVAIKGALAKMNGTISSDEIDEVIFGQVLTANEGQNPARQAARAGGLPYHIPATTVNMVCGSGLKAIILAAQTIRTGEAHMIIAGGQECVSQAPHCVSLRQGKKIGDILLVDSMLHDGMIDAFNHSPMGITAENVADACGIIRHDQDEYAHQSHLKCERAMSLRHFDAEIEPIIISTGKHEIEVRHDECPRQGVSIESLVKLNTTYKEAGTVTTGNASDMSDAAAAFLLSSMTFAKSKQLLPLARIVSWAQTGIDPLVMGLAPIKAIQESIHKASWSIDTVDLFEIDEAYAVHSLAIIRELNIDGEKVNVNGGSIALGHPLGAASARLLVTLIHTLIRTGLRRGCAAVAIGGGLGIAICIEAC